MQLDSSIAVAQRTNRRTDSCSRCINMLNSFANSTCVTSRENQSGSIAVAAMQPRYTRGYTPPVHRHSAAKRRPSSDGPRLTALAVFRPAETCRGRSTLPRRRTDTSANMGNCSSALSSSILCPAPPVALERHHDCLAALPPRFRVLLLRPRSQTPAFEAPA